METLLMEKLRIYGAKMEDIEERFMGDASFYAKCLQLFFADEHMDKLSEAMKNKNYPEAFEAGHALKGMVGNLALTPLYLIVCDLVDALRFKKYDKIDLKYVCLLLEFKKVEELLK